MAKDKSILALDGGKPVRKTPMPPRRLIGSADRNAVLKFIDACVDSGQAIGYGGPFEERYCRAFVRFMGGGFADAVNSGSNAVYCALGALQLEPFSEVIVPAVTDPGGVMPIPLLNLVPVIADSHPRSFNTSARQIAALINRRTRAIVIAHIAGSPVDLDPVVALARKHNLFLVEDCAQAHGATYHGKPVGTFGHIASFSTIYGKHHSTGGQGGIVYSPSEDLYWQARRFADRGKPFNISPRPSGNVVAGLNCNSSELAACLGLVQLRKLPGAIRRRQKFAADLSRGLKSRCRALRLAWEPDRSRSSVWFLVLHMDRSLLRADKHTLCAALSAEGIPCWADYPSIPCDGPWFADQAVFGSSRLPWSAPAYRGPKTPVFNDRNIRRFIRSHFCIPLHERFGKRELSDILPALRKVERAYLR